MKILIADDEPVSRRLLEATLVRLGHEVSSVSGGAAALAALLAPDAPRLAVLDWQMPDMDGLAVCSAVRAQAPAYVYIILLTSRGRQEDRTEGFDAGVDDFLIKPLDVLELRARLRSGERVLDLQARLLEAQEVLRHQATHDVLTGLWNRRRILEVLTQEVNRSNHERTPVAVALADIDHFKKINDTHGHGAGDDVLREVARRLHAVLRSYDAIGRYGGEEFLIVLPNCESITAIDVVERARQAVGAEPINIDAGSVKLDVSISAGVSWDCGPVDVSALIQTADAALYRAKDAGRNRVEGKPVKPAAI